MPQKYTLPVLFLCLLAIGVFAQNNPGSKQPAPQIYAYVEQMPVAGYDYNKYLSENIHYPDSAVAKNMQGRVIVKFVVNEDGGISDCTIARGIGTECDNEALRVVKSMPVWKPGMQSGKQVKVYFSLPVDFKLTQQAPENKDTVAKQAVPDVFEKPAPGYNHIEFIGENIQYPRNAWKLGKQGQVYVKFTINKDGSISDVGINQGVYCELDSEAVRIVRIMPKWKPGTHNGNAVASEVIMPITFTITKNPAPLRNPPAYHNYNTSAHEPRK